MKTNKKGISLIVLVITIIVMIILASAVILKLKETNISGSASEVTFKTDLSGLKDELTAYVINKEARGIAKEDITSVEDKTNDMYIKNIITSINEKYIDILKVEKGELKYTGDDANEKKWAKDLGILVDEGR